METKDILVYFSLPMLGYTDESGKVAIPTWMRATSQVLSKLGVKIYNPTVSLTEHLQDEGFARILSKPLDPEFIAVLNVLGLPGELLAALPDDPRIQKIIQEGDTGEFIDEVVFKDMYVLCRAHLVVVHGTTFSSGGVAQEVLYARQMEKLSVFVSNRFCNTPWMIKHTTFQTSYNSFMPAILCALAYIKNPFVFPAQSEEQLQPEPKAPKVKSRKRTNKIKR